MKFMCQAFEIEAFYGTAGTHIIKAASQVLNSALDEEHLDR